MLPIRITRRSGTEFASLLSGRSTMDWRGWRPGDGRGTMRRVGPAVGKERSADIHSGGFMFRLLKLVAYGLLGYAIYEFVRGAFGGEIEQMASRLQDQMQGGGQS